MKQYTVYAKTTADGYIAAVNSSAFLSDTTGWTEIDRGHGDKYHHAQGNYFPQPIYTESGVCRYKLVDGKPMECTADEIEEQEAAMAPVEPSPTLESRVGALEIKVKEISAISGEYTALVAELSEVYEDAET